MRLEGYEQNAQQLLRQMDAKGVQRSWDLRYIPTTSIPIVPPDCSGEWVIAKDEMVQRLTFGEDWQHYDEFGDDRRIVMPIEPRKLNARKKYSKAVRHQNSLDWKTYRMEQPAYETALAEHKMKLDAMISSWATEAYGTHAPQSCGRARAHTYM